MSQKFNYVNGYRIPVDSDVGFGGRELESNSVKYIDKKDSIKYVNMGLFYEILILYFFRFDPSLTYGRVRGITLPQYVPHFAQYDKKCLTFKAFFKQSVVESPLEHYRVRQVNIIYFLEDDSITVMEPKTPVISKTVPKLPKTDTQFIYFFRIPDLCKDDS